MPWKAVVYGGLEEKQPTENFETLVLERMKFHSMNDITNGVARPRRKAQSDLKLVRSQPPQPPDEPPITPQSLEAEQSTLGAMIMERDAIVRARNILNARDFYRQAHSTIFAAILSLADDGTPVDFITLVEELRRRDQLDEINGPGNGPAYLQALIEACPSAANVEAYARVVLETSQRRHAVIAADALKAAALSGAPLDAVAAALQSCTALTTRSSNRFPIIGLAEVLTRPRLDFLVQDFILERGTSVVTADYGAFKSFTILDMALCIASGKKWHERQVKRGPVVYIIAEGAYTTADRVRAWQIRYGLPLPDNFHVIESGVQIAEPQHRAALVAQIRHLNPVLVIFDTLSKCNVARDENDTGSMTGFGGAMREISNELNAQVLVVHHNNRAGTARGNSSLQADADTSIVMEKSAGRVVTIKCDRTKVAPFEPFALIGRVVEIPDRLDEYERPVTSLVFEPTDAPAIVEPVAKADATRERILKVLRTDSDFAKGARKSALQIKCDDFVKKSTFYQHLNNLETEQKIYVDSWGYVRLSDLSDLSDPDDSEPVILSDSVRGSLDPGQNGQTANPTTGNNNSAAALPSMPATKRKSKGRAAADDEPYTKKRTGGD